MADLKGKVAVVLGASAEGGIGWAIAKGLADAGARVVVAARSFDKLQQLAKKIDGLAVACDAGNEEQVAALAKVAKEKFGKVDIAVNSAGLPIGGFIAETQQKDLVDGIRVNYFGNVYFVKHMAEAIGRDGSIILISSMSSTHPVEPMFAYSAGKAASDCMVRYAALEYGPRNIKVNSILPGCVRTEMSAMAFTMPGYEEGFKREVPLARVAEATDIAEAALWLAGPSFVTGLNLQVSGGNQLTRFPRASEMSAGTYEAMRTSKPLGDRG
ncbi:MAG TPA: SDR family oxidoreductase [Nevskiaceae bacterium]|nr:SDR family oxidoreductase [Nevskiaceae bacterium]